MTTIEQQLARFRHVPSNHYVQQILRRSLGLDDAAELKPEHVRKAVEKSLKTPLRQSVGSCFATALTILLQEERVDLFFKDLEQILYQLRLNRVVDGVNCSVPISLYFEGENPLLKVWEFTVATLTDYEKAGSRHNLFSTLGLDPKQKGGVGEKIIHDLEEKFGRIKDDYNELVQEIEYNQEQLRHFYNRLQSASSIASIESAKSQLKAQNLKMDYLEIEAQQKKRGMEHFQSGVELFFSSLDKYLTDQFYEIFDPHIRGKTQEVYADTQAGFRLVFKNDITDLTLHQKIQDQREYIEILKIFFLNFERHFFLDHPELEIYFKQSIKILLNNLESDGFLQKLGSNTPWGYASGGSLESLIEGYFEKKGPFEKEVFYPESCQDLLLFYLETLKSLQFDVQKIFLENRSKRLLATFPTHAFTLLPTQELFLKGWDNNTFSYTWIRDVLIEPAKAFIAPLRESFLHLMEEAGAKAAYDTFYYQHQSFIPRLIFADSNWESVDKKPLFFCFQLDPISLELSIFATTEDSSTTRSLADWGVYFSGKHPFSIYTRPFEYGGPHTPLKPRIRI
jgi:hypothetical protein